jgi:hypothetical protein
VILTLHGAAQAATMTQDSAVDAIVEKREAANALTETMERLLENHFVSRRG